MLITFLEWKKLKEQELEEGRLQDLMRHDFTIDPKPMDVVITNPKGFMAKLMKQPGEKFMPTDRGISMALIEKIDDGNRVAHLLPMGNARTARMIDARSNHFRDVTDAFDADLFKGQLPPGASFLLHIPNLRDAAVYDQQLEQWRAHSAVEASPEKVAQRQMVGGEELVQDQSFKDARALKLKQYLSHAAQAQRGEDVTVHYKDSLTHGLVEFMRRKGAGAIIDQFHEKGLSHMVPGEEKGPPREEQKPRSRRHPMGGFQQPQTATLDAPTAATRLFGPQAGEEERVRQGPQSPIPMNTQNADLIAMARRGKMSSADRAARKFNDLFGSSYNPVLGMSRWKMFREDKKYMKYPVETR